MWRNNLWCLLKYTYKTWKSPFYFHHSFFEQYIFHMKWFLFGITSMQLIIWNTLLNPALIPIFVIKHDHNIMRKKKPKIFILIFIFLPESLSALRLILCMENKSFCLLDILCCWFFFIFFNKMILIYQTSADLI